jgi:acetyltransferase
VVTLRPLRPGDIDREMAFIEGLSIETLRLRMQYSGSSVTRADAARLLELDYHDRMAIGAFIPGGSGERLIGVSRYARVDARDEAECAIVVADDWHGRGLGTELMRSLGRAALGRAIKSLVGESMAENQRILAWARRFGFDARTEPYSGGMLRITLDLGSLAP